MANVAQELSRALFDYQRYNNAAVHTAYELEKALRKRKLELQPDLYADSEQLSIHISNSNKAMSRILDLTAKVNSPTITVSLELNSQPEQMVLQMATEHPEGGVTDSFRYSVKASFLDEVVLAPWSMNELGTSVPDGMLEHVTHKLKSQVL